MDKDKIWASLKKNKWKIWKYFKAVYFTVILGIAIAFILLLVFTIFI